ncbi:MAG: hypothetical protein LBC18_13495 [Opitutaceae bacterium]|nr:hypothetical protein [Opitutaceae bacterium]
MSFPRYCEGAAAPDCVARATRPCFAPPPPENMDGVARATQSGVPLNISYQTADKYG